MSTFSEEPPRHDHDGGAVHATIGSFDGRLGRVALVLALWAALITAFLVASTGHRADAESVRVHDQEDGSEAWFLAIRSARFRNNEHRVSVRVKHPTLRVDYVDQIHLSLLVGKPKTPPLYKVQYYVKWRNGRGARLWRQYPGEEYARRMRCKAMRIRMNEDDGFVRISLPVRCVKGGSKVRMGYLIRNDGGNVTDTVPGHSTDATRVLNWTPWLRRGILH